MILCKTGNKFGGINPETVGMDFEDSLENGGRSIKIFQISQSKKLDRERLLVVNGVIIKNKRDNHHVDCNVTGSNYGAPKDPKFQLEIFFENWLFPVIEKLVCDGGTFEGFAPFIQGENAVPHQDANFYKCVVNLCISKTWMW